MQRPGLSLDTLWKNFDSDRYCLMRNINLQCQNDYKVLRFQRDVKTTEYRIVHGLNRVALVESRLENMRTNLRHGQPGGFGGIFASDVAVQNFLDQGKSGNGGETSGDGTIIGKIPEEEEDSAIQLLSSKASSDDLQNIDDLRDVHDDEADIEVGAMYAGHGLKLKQFLFRIDVLKREIEDFDLKAHKVSSRRSSLELKLLQAQERTVLLNAEVDRLATYTGREIISSALHCCDQNISVRELKIQLRAELTKARINIASWKAHIIHGDEQRNKLLRTKSTKERCLEERSKAFAAYTYKLKCTGQRKLLQAKAKSSSTEKKGKRCISHWHQWARRYSRLRCLFSIFISNSLSQICKRAFQRWNSLTVSKEQEYEVVKEDSIVLSGAGCSLLYAAEIKSKDTASQTIELIRNVVVNNVQDTKHSNGEMKKPLDWKFLDEKGRYSEARCCWGTLLDSAANDKYCHTSIKDIAAFYSDLFARIGRVELNLNHTNERLFYTERGLNIASEFDLRKNVVDAFLCLGESYMAKEEQTLANANFQKALLDSKRQRDKLREVASHRGLEHYYQARGNHAMADKCRLDGDIIQFNHLHELKGGVRATKHLKRQVINATARSSRIITLQIATAHYVQLQSERARLEREVQEAKHNMDKVRMRIEELNQLTQEIIEQLAAGRESKSDKMTSTLVHDNTQEFCTLELVHRLELKLVRVAGENNTLASMQECQYIRVKDLEDNLDQLEGDIDIETGPLMQKVLKAETIRCTALSISNEACNYIMRGATGSVKFVVASKGKDIYAHCLRTGKIQFVFEGDEEGRRGIDVIGHTSSVTCLHLFGKFIYSGSTDKTIMCWNMEAGSRSYVARGHEATVTCVSVRDCRLVSGSADRTVGIWNSKTGELIERIRGHSGGILCVQCGPSWCLSGDSSGVCILWDEALQMKECLKCSSRCRITVVSYGELEVITGDSNGDICIWWIETGDILKKFKVHEGSVLDLQVDSTKVVSCGIDTTVQVVDVITGEVIQTLRGHTRPVLSVSFDSRAILSISIDGTLRRWEWGDPSARFGDKIHTLVRGERLLDLCAKYGITLSEIMLWNGISDKLSLYQGQKLIVKKEDPDSLTKAEIIAKKIAKREEMRSSRIGKLHNAECGTKSLVDDGKRNKRTCSRKALLLRADPDHDAASLANRILGDSLGGSSSATRKEREEVGETDNKHLKAESEQGSISLSHRLRKHTYI